MSVNGLGPYPAYRDSGVQWLGKVPEHWEVRRLRTLSQDHIANGVGESAQPFRPDWPRYVRITDIAGPASLHDATAASLPPELANGAMLAHGDLVFAAVGATYGKSFLYLGESDSACFAGYLVRLRPKSGVSPSFLSYWAQAGPYWEQVHRFVVQATIQNLSASRYKRFVIGLPPLPEQTAIARFLEAADRRIRRYIRAKERLIELLQERKRALIHEAVTGRTDVSTGQPYPAYKDSGVQWLGKVPKHWELRRLGATTERLVAGTWGSDPTGHDDIVCVRVADFDRGHYSVNLRKPTLRSVPVGERQRRLLKPGDLLLEKSGGGDLQPVGVVVHFDHDQEAVASNFIGRMRVHRQYSARYVLYLNSVLYAIRLTVRSIKQTTGIQNLDVDAYLSELVPLPPTREQRAIARFLEAADRRIRRHISATKRQIGLLREYRTRLIADFVTGKLDVREASARLPETDPLSADRNRAETIPTESNLHSTADEIAKEASA